MLLFTCKVCFVKNAFPQTSQTWDLPFVWERGLRPFEFEAPLFPETDDVNPSATGCDPAAGPPWSPTPWRRRSWVRSELERLHRKSQWSHLKGFSPEKNVPFISFEQCLQTACPDCGHLDPRQFNSIQFIFRSQMHVCTTKISQFMKYSYVRESLWYNTK